MDTRVDVNLITDLERGTSLHLACAAASSGKSGSSLVKFEEKQVHMVKLLLEHKADPKMVNLLGKTPASIC